MMRVLAMALAAGTVTFALGRSAEADTIALYEFSGDTFNPASSDSELNSTASDIDKGLGVSTLVRSSLGNPMPSAYTQGTQWEATDASGAKTNNDYLTFTVTPSGGYMLSLSTLSFELERDDIYAVTNYALYADEDPGAGGDNFTTQLGSGTFSLTGPNTWDAKTVDLSGTSFLQSVAMATELRLYLWGGQVDTIDGDGDKQRLDNVMLQGGTTIPEPGTWVLLMSGLVGLLGYARRQVRNIRAR